MMRSLSEINRVIKNVPFKLREWLLKPIGRRLIEQEAMLHILSNANLITRAMLNQSTNKPINVLFVCHEPTLWPMFESVYHAMLNDAKFSPLVVALPYRHGTLPKGQYKNAGIFEFCESLKIRAIRGYDKRTNEWQDPAVLMPDYVFFQTPYDIFPRLWSAERISMMARVCYIPYGTVLFRGAVDDAVHPPSYFRSASLIFKESPFCRDLLVNKFEQYHWFNEDKVIVSGHPKLDYLNRNVALSGKVWRRGMRADIKRILWTPRWNTWEGNSHFFDYKDFFLTFCKEQPVVDFAFRPHPLCLQNLLRTGELTAKDLSHMEREYETSFNMIVDKSEAYQDTFLTSDILVSDISSMMFEYFATGKPIIYTHRVDGFNELGRKLSEAFYWVRNAIELKQTLEMLMSGHDPLHRKRQELMKEVLFIPEGGSGSYVKGVILNNFNSI